MASESGPVQKEARERGVTVHESLEVAVASLDRGANRLLVVPSAMMADEAMRALWVACGRCDHNLRTAVFSPEGQEPYTVKVFTARYPNDVDKLRGLQWGSAAALASCKDSVIVKVIREVRVV